MLRNANRLPIVTSSVYKVANGNIRPIQIIVSRYLHCIYIDNSLGTLTTEEKHLEMSFFGVVTVGTQEVI